jgi:hypothetical protein
LSEWVIYNVPFHSYFTSLSNNDTHTHTHTHTTIATIYLLETISTSKLLSPKTFCNPYKLYQTKHKLFSLSTPSSEITTSIGPGEMIPPTMKFTSRHSDIPYSALLSYYPASTDYNCRQSTTTAHGNGHGHGNQHSEPINYPEEPNDMWHCYECGADNMNWTDLCPVCGKGTRSNSGGDGSMITFTPHHEARPSSPGFITYGGAGSAAPGAWVCHECGCANGSLNDW